MRAQLFFAAAALGATCSAVFSHEQPVEPSSSQMMAAFSRYLQGGSKSEGAVFEFASLNKEACKPMSAARGYNCVFSYVAKTPLNLRGTPLEGLADLSRKGVVAGSFVINAGGQFRFEMVLG